MTAPIGPGDWVECAPPSGYRGDIPIEQVGISGSYPKRGHVYRVREVGQYRTLQGMEDGLRLVGIVASTPGHPDSWWPARCFRPIYRPKAELIQSLLAPTPAKPVRVGEDA